MVTVTVLEIDQLDFFTLQTSFSLLAGYTLMHLPFGTPKLINFPFETNGKLIILDVPILWHIMAAQYDFKKL